MNQDPNIQGTPFAQVQQKQINSQPILSLANPTPFHLAAKSQRANNGAPPTPNNSFQNNNTLSDGTLDPQMLPYQQQQQYMIKQESSHHEFDLDNTNPMSPSSTTACNSPREQGFGSPSANSFEDFGRSYKPTSHIDAMMMAGGSANPLPTNSFTANSFNANSFNANSYTANSLPPNSMPANTFYENIPTDNYSNDDYIFSAGEIAMSALISSQKIPRGFVSQVFFYYINKV